MWSWHLHNDALPFCRSAMLSEAAETYTQSTQLAAVTTESPAYA